MAQKRAFRNRNPCDACQHTGRRKRHTRATPQASRFLNARIAPFAHCRRFRAYQRSLVRIKSKSSGVRGREGFNRRVSISVLHSNAEDLRSIGAPKLSACAAGIESERYDFDKISLVTLPEGIPLGLSRKESDILPRDLMGRRTESLSAPSK